MMRRKTSILVVMAFLAVFSFAGTANATIYILNSATADSSYWTVDYVYNQSEIEANTGDYGFTRLMSVINSYLPIGAYAYDAYVLSVNLWDPSGLGAYYVGVTSSQFPDLFPLIDGDFVLAYDYSIRDWVLIDQNTSGAYVFSYAYPFEPVVEDESAFDSAAGSPNFIEAFTVVAVKVYGGGGGGGGGGGCTVGGAGSLSWLLLFAPLALLGFKKVRKQKHEK